MENRILIYAPVGKDAVLASKVLSGAGLDCFVCTGIARIIAEMDIGVGAIFIGEEALSAGALTPLASYVAEQANWSDLPILVLTNHGVDSPGLQFAAERLGNVTLLERPVRAASLVSAARSALRARTRQYHMREADRLKDEFLASLGHELRNPLAPIRTAMQVLNRRYPEIAGMVDVTQIVERQVDHLTRLVDDLLDVARITSGKISLQRSHITLAAVVSHAYELCAPLLQASGHTLSISQPEQHVLLDADAARLVQSLSNVLANAVKFTPTPSVIRLDAQVDGAHVEFRIKDQGIGLDCASLTRIFEMFEQSEPALGLGLGGLGIGLGLTKRFVDMHGGTVHARSEGPGQGCEFFLRLPIVAQTANFAGAVAPDATATADADSARGIRVLVVDDNADGADMMHMMLELDGYTVYKAYDGKQAIHVASEVQPHAVLMDIGLPDMNGYQAARRIRQLPGGEQIVMIALTGWGHAEARKAAIEAGMDHHMVKPVNLDRLRDRLTGLTALEDRSPSPAV